MLLEKSLGQLVCWSKLNDIRKKDALIPIYQIFFYPYLTYCNIGKLYEIILNNRSVYAKAILGMED